MVTVLLVAIFITTLISIIVILKRGKRDSIIFRDKIREQIRFECQEISKEVLGFIDLSELMVTTVLSIINNPNEWVVSKHTAINENLGIVIWLANQIEHREFRKPENVSMALADKEILDYYINILILYKKNSIDNIKKEIKSFV